MKKKIAVIGLYSIPNMGDLILCETSQFLIREYGKKNDIDYEIIPMDLCPRFPSDYHGVEYIKYRLSRKMKTIASKKFAYEDGTAYRYRYEYTMWKLRLKRYYMRTLKNVDAIVFAGGGFLKFRTQGLNYYVEMVVDIALKYQIPVMMNGVGIEGYDETDIRCQKLKKAINTGIIKSITTRDDIDTLKGNYIVNPEIKIDRVGDPALWTPECYDVVCDEERNVFGINIIRGNIFKDYGNNVSAEDVSIFYKNLINELNSRNLDWVLFSNGMPGDQKFGENILRDLGIDSGERLLSAPKTSMELLNMIKTFKCIFGARLHACITAYSMDVQVVGFIWNEKTRMFSEIIDKRNNFFEEYEMDAKKIADRMVAASEETYDKKIREENKRLTVQYLEDFLSRV